jgi:Chlorophyll A-B binding protein
MKLSTSILAVAAMAATTSAFSSPRSRKTSSVQLQMSDQAIKGGDKSQSLPWLDRPEALDGTYQGDVGFDPLGFAKNKEDLRLYRESEIKHAVSLRKRISWKNDMQMLAIVHFMSSHGSISLTLSCFSRPAPGYVGSRWMARFGTL